VSARAKTAGRERRVQERGVDPPQGRVSPSASYLTVRELLAAPHLGLEIFSGSQGLERPIRCHRVQRLRFGADGGLRVPEGACVAAAGPRAVELLGRSAAARRRLLTVLSSVPVPALLVSRTRAVPEALAALSRRSTLPLLLTRDSLEATLTRLGFFLRNRLGAEITVHGVLVEVFGVGVLLLGPSGIGKSESALELVTRGHRLIADDMVIVHRGENRTLMGSGSGLARYHMEIRGIGIIDVKELYGVAAVLASAQIELVVQLEEWKTDAHYDRLGLEDHFRRMLDIPVAHLKVPVSPGRNIAVILEVAARNHLLKKQGYHSARELNRRLIQRTAGGEA
jgi:HPr kinase/phosphorylase